MLAGIREVIAVTFPNTKYQRCIVHRVRNTLKYVPDKDRIAFAKDIKTIYSQSMKKLEVLDRVTEKWTTTLRNLVQVYGECCDIT